MLHDRRGLLMSTRLGRFLAAMLALVIVTTAYGQDKDAKNKKKYKAASTDGTTGLFRTWDAETLRGGEFNLAGTYNHLNRDPGELNFKTVTFSGAYGLHDRFEA